MRHRMRALAATAAVALVAVACAPPDPGGNTGGDDDTVTIGFLRPATGPNAAPGRDMERGWKLYWKEHGEKVAGKQVKTVMEDTAGNPSIGLNKARELMTNSEADIIVGPMLANVGLAVADAVNREKVPMVVPIVSADDLTQRKPLPYVVRMAGWSSSQTTHPLGEYAAVDRKYKTAVTMCSDYAFGHESCGGFTNTFTDEGGKIRKKLWNPLGTQEFGTYMAQIKQAKPDVVFTEQVGVDSVRFVKAWNEFGMNKTGIELLTNETVVDQAALRSIGEGALGITSVGHFADGRETPDTKKFVDAYNGEYDEFPSYYAAGMYTAARGVTKALEDLDGDTSDRKKVVDTLKDVQLDETPFGPEYLDEQGNPVFNVYIREVQKRRGEVMNVPVKTYKEVGQFWKYPEEEFLDHPVYSKEYQGEGRWPQPTE
ncbi:MAG: ABC transporter substrate-binding protein [Streptosporangiales bacterium]|nr:ABC transporter substrate-binding protein [Streptosporangiales bacterium]